MRRGGGVRAYSCAGVGWLSHFKADTGPRTGLDVPKYTRGLSRAVSHLFRGFSWMIAHGMGCGNLVRGIGRRAFVRMRPALYRSSRGREGMRRVEVPCPRSVMCGGETMPGNRERRRDGLLPSKPTYTKERGTCTVSGEEAPSSQRSVSSPRESPPLCSRGPHITGGGGVRVSSGPGGGLSCVVPDAMRTGKEVRIEDDGVRTVTAA